jgi:cobalt/nickel transport system ATP-binding protein
MLIELAGVSCAYDQGDVLAGLDLAAGRGAAIAVIGPNGCGKSTLLKLLNGLVPPRAGEYRFDGEPVTAVRLREPEFRKRFHQRVGFLFQNPDAQLFCPEVGQEVAFGPRQMGLGEAEIAGRVEDCLALLGIAHLRGRAPYHLSEGEKRKVALASVLAMNPDVLVLDEPLNGLDPRSKRFMRDLLVRLNQGGKTLVCATHDFQYLDGVFPTAWVLGEDHRLARSGPFGEIVADLAFLRERNIL